METEEREERGSGRSQNVVHTLPRSMASVPHFLTGPLERTDPAAGETQVLVITSDPESAVTLAETVLRMTGPGGIELFPVTTARRAARLMAGRPVLAVAASPRDIQDLVRGSHIKMTGIRTIVLAWADEILNGDPAGIEALESIMGELPNDAARVVVTSRSEGRVNAFAERYLRRARREVAEDMAGEPISLQYLTVSPTGRAAALRRLLDDLDPPSAAVIVSSEEAEVEVRRTLRLLGYADDSSSVRVSRGQVEAGTHAVIFFDVPGARELMSPAVAASPVTIVALTEPREVSAMRRLAGGEVKPFTLSAPGASAREREAAIRRELAGVLDSGLASREVLALEPLLDRHDGIEIAAAALRLLEKERMLRKGTGVESRTRSVTPPAAAPARGGFDRGSSPSSRPFGDRPQGGAGRGRGGPPRGAESPPDARGRPPRNDRSRPPRDDRGRTPRDDDRRPPRNDGGSPPRDGFMRPPRRDRP
ncbi:MAG: DEAD/DEAH box helicase [Gemmatimonadaceae bacterium]|nr:DEAD/DEAH box helicase [Gemmatimonadaceae bacterium]